MMEPPRPPELGLWDLPPEPPAPEPKPVVSDFWLETAFRDTEKKPSKARPKPLPAKQSSAVPLPTQPQLPQKPSPQPQKPDSFWDFPAESQKQPPRFVRPPLHLHERYVKTLEQVATQWDIPSVSSLARPQENSRPTYPRNACAPSGYRPQANYCSSAHQKPDSRANASFYDQWTYPSQRPTYGPGRNPNAPSYTSVRSKPAYAPACSPPQYGSQYRVQYSAEVKRAAEEWSQGCESRPRMSVAASELGNTRMADSVLHRTDPAPAAGPEVKSQFADTSGKPAGNQEYYWVNEFGDTICPSFEGVRVWPKGTQAENPWEERSKYDTAEVPRVWECNKQPSQANVRSEKFKVRNDDEQVRGNDAGSHFRSPVKWQNIGLPPEFLGVLSRCRCVNPSKVQAEGLRFILENESGHLLAQSPTGSGKTLTFVLGTLTLVDRMNDKVQVICVAPTSELLTQLALVYKMYAQTIGVSVVHCGRFWQESQVMLMAPMQFLYHLRTQEMPALRFVVIDEADHMLNSEDSPLYAQEMGDILTLLPTSCRVLLFSATFSEEILTIIDELLVTYERIAVRNEDLVLDNIRLYYVRTIRGESKLGALERILACPVVGVTLVFVNNGKQAQLLVNVLNRRGQKTALMAGSVMTTQERRSTLDEFRRGHYSVLVATNVLARGIDDTRISRVVNYDIPLHWTTCLVDAETFLHRVGRAGRFARAGEAISIITCEEELTLLEDVMMQWGCQIESLDLRYAYS